MIIDDLIRRAEGYVPGVIVHVGAHKGGEAGRYETLGARRVIWIEADDETAEMARRKLARRSGATEHTLLQALITDADGVETPFHVFSNKGGSSSIFRATGRFHEHWPQVRETGEVKTLTSSRLETALDGLGLAPEDVDVMVLDVQGAELLCLKGAGRYLDHVTFLEIEVSQEEIYEGGALWQEVDGFLSAAGFRRLSPVLRHGDVIYMRESRIGDPRFAAIRPD